MARKDTIVTTQKKIKAAGRLINRAVLVVLSRNQLGKCFVLNRAVNIVGRRDDCDIRLSDPLVSNRHFRITCNEAGHFQIEDLGSTNSTYLNDKTLKKTRLLSYGDRIIAGKTIMRFFYEEEFLVRK